MNNINKKIDMKIIKDEDGTPLFVDYGRVVHTFSHHDTQKQWRALKKDIKDNMTGEKSIVEYFFLYFDGFGGLYMSLKYNELGQAYHNMMTDL